LTLRLDPMTFIQTWHALRGDSLHQICKYELSTSRLLKVTVWETYIQTDRQMPPKL